MEDVAAEDDGLLFEAGVSDFAFLGGRRFNLSFVRQFALYEDGEYDRMEQLRCVFLYQPVPELEALPKEHLWSFDLPLEEFFARVEQLRGFRAPVEAGLMPVGVWVEQGQA